MPVFINNSAFWGLLSLFVLIAIYVFRNRSKTIIVSSILLWHSGNRPSEGGRKTARPPLTLLLILELIILTLFILATAKPRIMMGESIIPIVIILDDSFSMGAGKENTPQEEAAAFIRDKILSKRYFRISLLKAGTSNKFIGRRHMTPTEASQLLSNWKCDSPTSNLTKAIKVARNASTKTTQFVVVTDHEPSTETDTEIWWLAFGSPTDNFAITKAKQYSFGGQTRSFFEFTNFSSKQMRLKANIGNKSTNEIIKKIDIQMAPGSSRQYRLTLGSVNTALVAEILNDEIRFDNTAYLLPEPKRVVTASIQIQNSDLAKALSSALTSTRMVKIIESKHADIVFVDANSVLQTNKCKFVFHNSEKPVLIQDSIFIDKSHPICDGIDLQPCYWAIAETAKMPGHALLSAGENILLSVSGSFGNNLRLDMNLSPDYSNFKDTVAWPILIHNIVAWNASFKEGPVSSNIRAGTLLELNFANNSEQAIANGPTVKEIIHAFGNKGGIIVSEPGLYSVEISNKSWPIAVNVLSQEESDLRKRTTSQIGTGLSEAVFIQKSANAVWWFLLPAILLLGYHQWLINKRSIASC